MTLKDAIADIEKRYGGKVHGVSETKDKWIFDVRPLQEGCIFLGRVPAIYKSSGQFTSLFPPDDHKELDSARDVDISMLEG
ncbi:hypothetical protein [Selenomonas sp.]|uniref:hypothetical protein n=1 Tax=Selenomonas sp. TaxID=2053611 RepID=UPI002A74951F|nr:hypothetical protein [Selenomonas sp.]MDY3296204.1 hypothetical protein [Selenomonas sp.]